MNTCIVRGLYLLIFLHHSTLMNRLAFSGLLTKICSKFQSEKSFRQRSFSFMAPSLWNLLPATLRNEPNIIPVQISLKNLLVCPDFPVEFSTLSGKKSVSVCGLSNVGGGT